MQKLKAPLLLVFFLTLLSCSGSDDSSSPVEQPATFAINQSVPNLEEGSEVTFTVSATSGNPSLASINWYLNNEYTTNDPNFFRMFATAGSYTVKAEIQYYKNDNTLATATVEKTVTVTQRPKFLVKIKKVEILSFSGQSQFYTQFLGYYLRASFDIKEFDSSGTAQDIKYISAINSDNWAVGDNINYPITWNMAGANYSMVVYKTGNDYPNHQQSYNTLLTFYGAKRSGDGQTGPYNVINTYGVDLNPYRSLKPATISVNNNGMQIQLTLEWNG